VAAVNITTQEDTRMAELKEIHIGFKKTVSDGSYGNETHEARLTVTPTAADDGVDVRKVLELFATILEGHVNSRFRQSPSDHIRYAMESPEEREARYKREAEEREVERERRRAERDARLAAEDADDDDSPF
jgi:pyruvate-formate lyase-activating enzyme